MKTKLKQPGGCSRPCDQTITKSWQSCGKFFVGMTREEHEADREAVEREDAERLKAMGLKATPNGIVPIDEREAGREAAYEELVEKELCIDLAGKCARESANRTGDAIANVRDNYEAIVLGFNGARSLSVVLRNETDQAPGDFLRKLGNWIGDYVSYCIQGKEDRCNWTLSGHTVSKELLTALAEEYVRDRVALMQFLSAVFERWQKIEQPNSIWRLQLIAQQHLGKPKVVAEYAQNVGAVSKCTTAGQIESLRARIKQHHSRDRKSALEKRRKAR